MVGLFVVWKKLYKVPMAAHFAHMSLIWDLYWPNVLALIEPGVLVLYAMLDMCYQFVHIWKMNFDSVEAHVFLRSS